MRCGEGDEKVSNNVGNHKEKRRRGRGGGGGEEGERSIYGKEITNGRMIPMDGTLLPEFGILLAILSSNPSFKLFELALRFSKFHFARGVNGRRRKKEEKKPVPI